MACKYMWTTFEVVRNICPISKVGHLSPTYMLARDPAKDICCLPISLPLILMLWLARTLRIHHSLNWARISFVVCTLWSIGRTTSFEHAHELELATWSFAHWNSNSICFCQSEHFKMKLLFKPIFCKRIQIKISCIYKWGFW